MSGNKVRAFGPGLEPKGNIVGEPASFTVETANAGKGKLDVVVWDPKGKQVKCDAVLNKDKKTTYSCVYTPQMEGKFKIVIHFGGKEVVKSPFYVEVAKAAAYGSKLAAKYPAEMMGQTEVRPKPEATSSEKAEPKVGAAPFTGAEPSTTKSSDAGTSVFTEMTPEVVDEPPTRMAQVFGPEPSPKSKPKTGAESLAELKSTSGADPSEERKQKSSAEPSKVKGRTEPSAELKPKPGTEPAREQKPDVGAEPFSKTASEPSSESDTKPDIQCTPEVKSKSEDESATEATQTVGDKTATKKVSKVDNLPTAKEIAKDDSKTFVDLRPNADVSTAAKVEAKSNVADEPFAEAISKSKGIIADKELSETKVDQTEAAFLEHVKGKEKLDPTSQLKAARKVEDLSVSGAHADVKASHEYQAKAKDEPLDQTEKMAKEVPPPLKPRPKLEDVSPSKVPKDGAESKVKMTSTDEAISPSKDVQDTESTLETKATDKEQGVPQTTTEPWIQQKAEPLPPAKVMEESGAHLASGVSEVEVRVGGLELPLRLGETRKINVLVHDKNCAHAQCAVTMVTSNGTMTSAPLEMKTECYDFLVTPEVPGQHKIRIEYAGKEVSGSPFALDVEVIDISSVKVKGLQTSVVLDETRPVSIITSGVATQVPCNVTVITPKGYYFDLPTFTTTEGYGTYFSPSEVGLHDVTVYCAGQEVPGSPFTVMVEKKSAVVRGLESLLGIK